MLNVNCPEADQSSEQFTESVPGPTEKSSALVTRIRILGPDKVFCSACDVCCEI